MLRKILICSSLVIFHSLCVNAQHHLTEFLKDISVKDFKLGSKLDDLEKNKNIASNLSETPEEDNTTVCSIKNLSINFYDLDVIDEIILGFKSKSLNYVVIEFINDFVDDKFEKTYSLLKSKYGEPMSYPTKNSSYKTYIWEEGGNKLMLKPLKISYLIKYYRKKGIHK